MTTGWQVETGILIHIVLVTLIHIKKKTYIEMSAVFIANRYNEIGLPDK